MKKTLLEIVRDILNDLDSDEVNSIDDTTESQQVANIVKACYENMISNRTWPHLRKLIQIDSAGDIAKPTHMRIPETMHEMELFKYDVRKQSDAVGKVVMKEIRYKYPDEFLRYVSQRNTDNESTEAITDYSGSKILILNNVAPSYWTSFDDDYIVCDSYDKTVDDTLKKTKTQVLAYMDPVWVHLDDAVPDLPSDAFAALVEEAKSTAFVALKQMANEKAEQKARKQDRWLARKDWRTNGGVRYDDYGRKGRRRG